MSGCELVFHTASPFKIDVTDPRKELIDPAWRIVLKDLGVSEDEVLRRARLPLDLLSRKNAALSAEEYFRLCKGLEAAFDDPCFPLRIGQMISTEAFSPPIFASLCSPNLNKTLENLARHYLANSPIRAPKSHSCWDSTTRTLSCGPAAPGRGKPLRKPAGNCGHSKN